MSPCPHETSFSASSGCLDRSLLQLLLQPNWPARPKARTRVRRSCKSLTPGGRRRRKPWRRWTGEPGEHVDVLSSPRYVMAIITALRCNKYSLKQGYDTNVSLLGHVLDHHYPCVPQYLCSCHWALPPAGLARWLPGGDQPLLRCAFYLWNVPQNVQLRLSGKAAILSFSVQISWLLIVAGLLRVALQSLRLLCCDQQYIGAYPDQQWCDASTGTLSVKMCSSPQDLQSHKVGISPVITLCPPI